MRRALVLVLALGFASLKCGSGVTDSSFTNPGSGGSSSGGMSGSGGRSNDDPTIGLPCLDSGQCDDGIACTTDSCDTSISRCRHQPSGDACADGVYCNGVEVCEPGVGCRAGPPVACSDSSTCTIDRCVEESRSCQHFPRDADGDGDPVWNCGGTDCDDDDPTVNGKHVEICGNGKDDDCDQIPESVDPCVAPEHDGCADALEIDRDQTVELSLLAAAESVTLGCVETDGARRDVVVALTVGEEPRDVFVEATSDDPGLALSFRPTCSVRSPELACSAAIAGASSGDGYFARLRLYGLEQGSYPLFVSGLSDSSVSLTVRYEDATPTPDNETCGTALPLPANSQVTADLSGVAPDLTSRCAEDTNELVYRFELDEAQDVVVRATSRDGYGEPLLSLRSEHCTDLADELDCRLGQPTRLFRRALPAGVYYLAVSATGPSRVDVDFKVSAATAAEANESCEDPPLLTSGVTLPVELAGHVNSTASSCMAGTVDAVYALELEQASDVLLVERVSAGDAGAVSLVPVGCAAETELSCHASPASPVRARAFAVPPGEYRVVAESRVGSPIELTAFTRPAAPQRVVTFADGCSDAVLIPPTGGRFSGNTANAHADFEASCDYGGVLAGGASEQMLRLELDAPRRVILDMAGSSYATILVVRKAESCPGPELVHACAPGRDPLRGDDRSFLDLTLDAGAYFVQIDGYASADGPWNLDVYVVSP